MENQTISYDPELDVVVVTPSPIIPEPKKYKIEEMLANRDNAQAIIDDKTSEKSMWQTYIDEYYKNNPPQE